MSIEHWVMAGGLTVVAVVLVLGALEMWRERRLAWTDDGVFESGGLRLIPGHSYEVVEAFPDCHGITQRAEKLGRFICHSLWPYDNGIMLRFDRDGTEVMIRLQEGSQDHILGDLQRYLREIPAR